MTSLLDARARWWGLAIGPALVCVAVAPFQFADGEWAAGVALLVIAFIHVVGRQTQRNLFRAGWYIGNCAPPARCAPEPWEVP